MAKESYGSSELSLKKIAEELGIEPPTLSDVYGKDAEILIRNATRAKLSKRTDPQTKSDIDAAIETYINCTIVLSGLGNRSAEECRSAIQGITTVTRFLSSLMPPNKAVTSQEAAIRQRYSSSQQRLRRQNDIDKINEILTLSPPEGSKKWTADLIGRKLEINGQSIAKKRLEKLLTEVRKANKQT